MKFSDISSGLGDCDFWPPGFRFHPTDEELVLFYLKRKICHKRLKPDIIREIDVYKCDPEEFPGLSGLKSGDRQWFFFSPRDRKYPNGARANRATKHGYWKATGKDRIITYKNRSVGVKKTLVFYKGRAPTGQRTDWVMHEYTLDEEEYKRCQVSHDYYALYKTFKKSGPGPKNGEQYGAPFKEEDWADELECGQMSRIPDEPVNVLVGNEESLSAMMGSSSREPTHQLASHEAPEVASGPSVFGVDEDFLKDFLEMDDLDGGPPEPAVQNTENSRVENFQFDELDGLFEFDLYHDAAMFLRDVVPVDQVLVSDQSSINPENGIFNVATGASHPYLNNFENGMVNNTIESEMMNPVSQLYSGNLNNNDLVNQFDYQYQPQIWGHDHRSSSIYTLMEPNCGFITEPSSGAVYAGNNSSNLNQNGENENKNENGGTDSSWLSSALWGFVESIPTTPASASSNRVLGRISSFNRLRRVSVLNTKSNTGNPNPNPTSSSGRRRNSSSLSSGKCCIGIGGFFCCFSFVGVLCALFYMLIGTSIKILGRFISS